MWDFFWDFKIFFQKWQRFSRLIIPLVIWVWRFLMVSVYGRGSLDTWKILCEVSKMYGENSFGFLGFSRTNCGLLGVLAITEDSWGFLGILVITESFMESKYRVSSFLISFRILLKTRGFSRGFLFHFLLWIFGFCKVN